MPAAEPSGFNAVSMATEMSGPRECTALLGLGFRV